MQVDHALSGDDRGPIVINQCNFPRDLRHDHHSSRGHLRRGVAERKLDVA